MLTPEGEGTFLDAAVSISLSCGKSTYSRKATGETICGQDLVLVLI